MVAWASLGTAKTAREFFGEIVGIQPGLPVVVVGGERDGEVSSSDRNGRQGSRESESGGRARRAKLSSNPSDKEKKGGRERGKGTTAGVRFSHETSRGTEHRRRRPQQDAHVRSWCQGIGGRSSAHNTTLVTRRSRVTFQKGKDNPCEPTASSVCGKFRLSTPNRTPSEQFPLDLL